MVFLRWPAGLRRSPTEERVLSPKLRIHSQACERGMVRLDIQGSLCADTLEVLQTEFQRWFEKGVFSFLIQLHHLREMTNAGCAVFICLLRAAQEGGGRVSLLRPTPAVREALELHSVLPLIHIVSSAQEVA